MSREKRYDGPVIVAESPADPGDMGEPREFWSDEDKATVLIVPSPDFWADQTMLGDLLLAVDRALDELTRRDGGLEEPVENAVGILRAASEPARRAAESLS